MRAESEDDNGGPVNSRGDRSRASRIRTVRGGKTARTRSTKRAVGGMHQRRNKHSSW